MAKSITIFFLFLFIFAIPVQSFQVIEEDFGDYKYIESAQDKGDYMGGGYVKYVKEGLDMFYVSILEFPSPELAEEKLSSTYNVFDIIEIDGNKVLKQKNGEHIAWFSGKYYVDVSDERVDAVEAYLKLYPSSVVGDIQNPAANAKYKSLTLVKEDIGPYNYVSFDIEQGSNYKKYNLEYEKRGSFKVKVYEFRNIYQARAYFAKSFATNKILTSRNQYFVEGYRGYIVENIRSISWVSGRFIIDVYGHDLDIDGDLMEEYNKYYPSDLEMLENYDIITDNGYETTISFAEEEFYASYQEGLSISNIVVMIQKNSETLARNAVDLKKVGEYLGYDMSSAELVTEDKSNYYYKFDAPDDNLYEIWFRGATLYVIQKSGRHKDYLGSFTQNYLKKIPSHMLPTFQRVALEEDDESIIQLPDCDGCKRQDGYCYEVGSLVMTGGGYDYNAYCSKSGKFIALKEYGEECERYYECESRQCREGACYDIAKKTEGKGFLRSLWIMLKDSIKHTFS